MTGPTFVQIGCSILPRKRSIACGFKVFWNPRPWKGSNTLRTREGLPHHQKTIDFVWFWLVFQASLGQICWKQRYSLKLAFEEAVHDRFDHFLRCPRILYLVAIFFGNCTIYFSLVQVLSFNLAYIAELICDKWEKNVKIPNVLVGILMLIKIPVRSTVKGKIRFMKRSIDLGATKIEVSISKTVWIDQTLLL